MMNVVVYDSRKHENYFESAKLVCVEVRGIRTNFIVFQILLLVHGKESTRNFNIGHWTGITSPNLCLKLILGILNLVILCNILY